MTSFARQLYDATLIGLIQFRRDLWLVVAFAVVFPLGFLFFLGHLVEPGRFAQVVAGSVMMEMGLININILAQNIGQDKASKIYDLWVSLPINPAVYVLSTALSFLPMSLLSSVVTLAIGIAFFQLGIAAILLPELIAAFLLIWVSTLGVGFLIGVYGRTPRQINQLANVVGVVLTFITPIFYPASELPPALRYAAELWPLTWGASLLRAILGTDYAGIGISSAVLVVFSAFWVGLIAAGLRWRQV